MATAGGDVAPFNAGDPYGAAVAAACNCCVTVICPNCDDENACTRDYCEIECTFAYCVHTTINCNDENACTTDGCGSATGCFPNPINCNDGVDCTNDGCFAATGCDNGPKCVNPDRPQCCGFAEDEFACCMADQVCCRYRWAGEGHPDNGCCPPNTTCCGAGCCQSDETCCNNQCGKKGACCFFDTGSCSELTSLCCAQQGGAYQDDGTSCSPEDLCRPKCENCQLINTTFYECQHEATEPCAPSLCIEDIMITASCSSFPYRKGPEKCNTVDSGVSGQVIQRLYAIPIPMICETSSPGGFHLWTTTYQGCGTTCNKMTHWVRCDTSSCAGGILIDQQEHDTIHECGCPVP